MHIYESSVLTKTAVSDYLYSRDDSKTGLSIAEWLARLTAVWEDPGSNHAADSCVYRDSSCDGLQSWARAVHLYCSAFVDSAFHPSWDGKMSISLRAE